MYRIILSFLISFILLLAVIALNRITHNNSQSYTERTEHSKNVITLLNVIDVNLRSAEIFSPTFENSAAKNLYAIYKADMNKLEPNLVALRKLISDNAAQVILVDSAAKLIHQQLPVLRQKNMAEIIEAGEISRFLDLQTAHQLIRRSLVLEENLLKERRTEMLESNRVNNLLTLLLAILAVTIISLTFFSQFFMSKRRIWLEGFLESILNTTQNGIVYYKAVRKEGKVIDFKVEFANKVVLHLLKTDPKKLIGKKLTQLDSDAWRTEIFPVYLKALQTGEPVLLEHLYKSGGKQQWLDLSIAKMGDGITVAFHDISAIKRYEEQLKTNIAALEQSNSELEEYAYAASHDLQEPLRKIKTFGSYLRDTQLAKLDEKGKTHLEKILQSADRMSLLIKDLLSFSGLKTKEKFLATDLNHILQNVLKDMEVLIEQKKAIITHDPLPEIEAIPIQMNQIFYNLVNNSLKFAREDLPLHMDINCTLLPKEEARKIEGLDDSLTYYEIIFSDNGIGFNQDYANQIFGLFKRLNERSTYSGSGIGLAICKRVVSNHKGTILATGKENVGAQFYIYLPKKQKPIEPGGAENQ